MHCGHPGPRLAPLAARAQGVTGHRGGTIRERSAAGGHTAGERDDRAFLYSIPLSLSLSVCLSLSLFLFPALLLTYDISHALLAGLGEAT